MKQHLQKSVRCLHTEEEIKTYFSSINIKLKTKSQNICIYCNKLFSRTDSLSRHNINSKCFRNRNKNKSSELVNAILKLKPNVIQEITNIINKK